MSRLQDRYADVTADVDAGPSGREIAAFFDVDRTILSEFSATGMFREGVKQGMVSRPDIARALATAVGFQFGAIDFDSLISLSGQILKGRSSAELEALTDDLYTRKVSAIVYPEARALVEAHRRKGHTIVLLSSATRYQVQSLARDLDVHQMICNDYVVRDGLLTGEMVEPVIYGVGKLEAARELAAAERIDLSKSWFYSDGFEDLPLLEEVGHPRPTNPSGKLASAARDRNMKVLRFTSRGNPGVEDFVRTAGVAGSFLGAAAASVPFAVLNRSMRSARNTASGLFGDLSIAFSGIDLRVEGEEHLWEQRPAVFVFNHQSQMDVAILAKLLREDFTGVGKQELRSNPLIGPILGFAGVVFIDRSQRDKAIHQLEPAVDALRNGVSLAIAPEGTRMPTPHIGRFKKGPFHIAMQAGVPVVPIALRNTLDVMPKSTWVVRKAPVDVVVHPPIDVSGWTHDSMDDEIAKLRRWFQGVIHG